MSGFNHAIVRLPASSPYAGAGRWDVGCHERSRKCPGKHVAPAPWNPSTTHTVGGPVTLVASFDYVTGRGGRVTTRELYLCEHCGAKWAAKHGLQVPIATNFAPTVREQRDAIVSSVTRITE